MWHFKGLEEVWSWSYSTKVTRLSTTFAHICKVHCGISHRMGSLGWLRNSAQEKGLGKVAEIDTGVWGSQAWSGLTDSAEAARLLATSIPAFWAGNRYIPLSLKRQPSVFKIPGFPSVYLCHQHVYERKHMLFLSSFSLLSFPFY